MAGANLPLGLVIMCGVEFSKSGDLIGCDQK